MVERTGPGMAHPSCQEGTRKPGEYQNPAPFQHEGAVSGAATPMSGMTECWRYEMLEIFCLDVLLP